MRTIPILGLTGGIASGKSTVSKLLCACGAEIVDADAITHQLSSPGGEIWELYRAHFGDAVLSESGELRRAWIAEIVFSNPKEKEWMDSTLHPVIKAAVEKEIARTARLAKRAIVLDVPLLIESGWKDIADVVWVVHVPPAMQVARLMMRNGYSKEEALRRIAAQMPLEEKKKFADVVIDNSGTLKRTKQQVTREFKSFCERYEMY